MINKLERLSLIVAAIGTALTWIGPVLFVQTAVPEWIVSRWSLLVCFPASILGIRTYRSHSGFARSPALILCAVLMVFGIMWTDPTERGRAMLLATAFMITLPMAALIRKQQYLTSFLLAFAVATTGSLVYSLTNVSGFNGGTVVDAAGTAVSNANGIGAQAALAALFVLVLLSSRKRVQMAGLFVLAAVLVVFCVMTASRTSFLALTGAFLVSLFLAGGTAAAWRASAAVFMIVCAVAVNAVVQPDSQFYDGLVSRLIRDDEGTRGTLGDRQFIWSAAATEFATGNTWLYGTGTGGVNKMLGASSEDVGRVRGKDGIWRRSAHNTVVWWTLTFGTPGLIACLWLGFSMVWAAYSLDRKAGGWQRSTLVAFVVIVSVGGVITESAIWCVLAPTLWVLLSGDALVAHRPRPRFSAVRVPALVVVR